MLSVIEKVLLLQEVEILQSVKTEHLSYIAQITDERDFSENEIIYHEGDNADALYVVISGEVGISRKSQKLMTAGPKSAFGIWALFDENERVVSAVCETSCHLLCLTKEDFHDVLADHSEISRSVLSAMARRLRGLIDRVALSGGGESN